MIASDAGSCYTRPYPYGCLASASRSRECNDFCGGQSFQEGHPCTWLIYGYVDLEKASGAIDHRQYITTIVYSGNNRWRMKELHWQAAFKSQKASGAESP